jgi:hypothetical protein
MTPREKVSNLLEALGFDLQAEEIEWVKGAHSHYAHDVLERWRGNGYRISDRKAVEFTGLDSVTACAKGLVVKPNEPDSQYYGDYTVEAVKHASEPVKTKRKSRERKPKTQFPHLARLRDLLT